MAECEMRWHAVGDGELEGKGWRDTAHPFDRLPAHAAGVVPDVVYDLAKRAPDLLVHFRTDATDIHARTVLRPPLSEAHLYWKYLDLYARDEDGRWRWAGVSEYGYIPSGETPLAKGLPPAMREYRLYLPPFFSIDRLAVGVPEGSHFEFLPPRRERPLVVYGTSIVHGSSASRPGMIFTGMLGRRLDVPVVNLGVSGSARCEPELGAIVAELDASAFVIDPLPNMSEEKVRQNAEPFMRKLLEAHPDTPMLMVEDRSHSHEWLYPKQRADREAKRAAFREVFDRLRGEGASVLRYFEGDPLLGGDSDLTVDGSHPSDLGYRRMADVLEPAWRELLGI